MDEALKLVADCELEAKASKSAERKLDDLRNAVEQERLKLTQVQQAAASVDALAPAASSQGVLSCSWLHRSLPR